MKFNPKLLECLFGHHAYGKKLTLDKNGFYVHLCKHCKRRGYYEWRGGLKTWRDYDEEGNMIHTKWSDGSERWYDKEGNMTKFNKRSG